jgi:ankyrin repeat protein
MFFPAHLGLILADCEVPIQRTASEKRQTWRELPASMLSWILGTNNTPQKSLDETYEQALLNIEAKKQEEYAQYLFQCLTVSIRPLRVDELTEIFALRFDSVPNCNSGWLSGGAVKAVLSACSSLITVTNVDGSQVTQFSDPTVKEFLTSNRLATVTTSELSHYHILPGPAHIVMAKACLSVLLKLGDGVDKKTIEDSPFALYAARHWFEHAQFGDVSSHIQDIMLRLFDPDKSHFRTWIWLFDMDRHWENNMCTPHPTRPRASSLYYAALCGFDGVVEHLIRTHPSYINAARGGYYVTPLHASLRKGHREITSLLLGKGAHVDGRGIDGATPLHRACRAGNLDVIRLLLRHKADVQARNIKQERPLHFAAVEGEAEICRLLIEHGADINCRDNQGWSPLHSGSRYGHLEVVRLLLDHGADVNAKKKDDWSPLHLATTNGKFEVVRLLIQHGATIDVRNENQETPLDRAAANGCLDIAQLLLKSGANVNVIDKNSWTPLHTASLNGCREIAQLLLESGADLTAQTEFQKTPLFVACGNGKLDVARFLLERGSNPNVRDKDRWTPLHSVARCGYLDVTRLLLDSGADVNVHKADRWTPMHLASANGHLDTAKLLVERGANIDSRNATEETSLDRAAANGFLDLVRFLVESGADVFARDNKGWTPFHAA